MAKPQGSAEHAGGNPGGHGVGIAMIAIFAGVVLVVTFLASDGAIFGQNFQSSPSQDLPVSESGAGGAAVISSDTFGEASDAESSSATAPPPKDGATLSEEERRLLAMKDFPWNSVVGGQISSNQDAFQRFGQQSVAQRPAEAGTEPLSISDRVAIDVDRRVENDGSDPDTFLADIIEIDIPIGDDDEEEREEAEERPEDVDDTQDQDEEPQDDGTENDREGSDNGTEEDSSGRDSGEDNSGSGSDDEQSEDETGDGGGSDSSNSTDTSGPSEDSGSENDEGDGNSTGTEVSISLE